MRTRENLADTRVNWRACGGAIVVCDNVTGRVKKTQMRSARGRTQELQFGRHSVKLSQKKRKRAVAARFFFPPPDDGHPIAVGGVAKHVTDLVVGLERRDHEVRLPLEPTKTHNVTELAAGLERT
jgi:hypothetical protein